jgi:hypothetical protein
MDFAARCVMGRPGMELDKNRLIKFLNMTDSQHDAEVLIAIRKANELLRLHRVKWTDLVGTPPRPRVVPAEPRAYEPRPEFRRQEFRRPVRRRGSGFGWGWLLVLGVIAGSAWAILGLDVFDPIRTYVMDIVYSIQADIRTMLR